MSYRNKGSEPRPEVFERLDTVSSDHNDYSYNSSYRNHSYNNSNSDYYRYRRRSPSLYYNDRYDDRYEDRYNDRYDDRYGDGYYNDRYSYKSSDSGLKIAKSYNNSNNTYHHKQDYYSSSSDKSRINFVKNDKKPISFVPNKSSEDSYDRREPSPTTDRDKVARDLQITVTRDKKSDHQEDKQDDAYNTSSATSREIAMAPSQTSEFSQPKSSSYKTGTKYTGNGAGTDNKIRSNSQADQQKSQVERSQSPPNKSRLEKKSVDNNRNDSSVKVSAPTTPTTPTRKPAPSSLPAIRETKSDSTVHLEKPPIEPAAMRNGKIAGLLDPLPKSNPVTTKNVNNLSADSESTKRDSTTTPKQTPTKPSSIRTTVNQKDRGNNPIKEKSDSQGRLSNTMSKTSLSTTNDPKSNTSAPSAKLTPSATAKTLDKQDIKTTQSSQLKIVTDNRLISPNPQEQQKPKQQQQQQQQLQQPAPPATTVAHGQQEPIKHTEESTPTNDPVSMHAPSQTSVEQQKKELEKKLGERHVEQLQELLRLQEGEEELARERVNKETEADQNTITTLQELIKSSKEKQSKHEEQMSMFPPESQEWMEARNNIEVTKIFIKDLNDQYTKIMNGITSILNQQLEAIQTKFKELIIKAREEYDSEKKQIDDSFKIKKSDSSTKKSATSIKNATETSATTANPQVALLTNQRPTQDTMKQQASEQITSNSVEKQNAIPPTSPVKATHTPVETGRTTPTPQKQTLPEPTKQTIPTLTAPPQMINTAIAPKASKMDTNDTGKQNNVNNLPNNPIPRKRRRVFADTAEASIIIDNDVPLTSPDTTTTTTNTLAPSPKQQHIEKPVDEEQVERAVKRHTCDTFVPADHGTITPPLSASASAQSLNETNLPKKDRRELLLPIDERDDVVIDIFTKKGAVHRQSPASTNPITPQTSPVEVPISDPMEVDQESIRDSNKTTSAQETRIKEMSIEQPVTEAPGDKKPVIVDSSTISVPAKKPRTTTKVPKIWKVRMDDDTGDVYYQHRVTEEIRLDRPC